MNSFKFVLVAVLSLLAFASASNVVDLTTENFNDFLSTNEFVLVEFYAPWCGHCKHLAPEYEKAADQLAAEGSPIKLAKVDATKQEALGQQFQVQGYPTLIWFRNGQRQEYSGPREAAGIVAWVTKKTGPITVTVVSKAELDEIARGDAVVGFFEKDSNEHKVFVTVAQIGMVESIPFVDVTCPELTKEAGASVNTVKLYRSHGEPLTFDGPEFTDRELFSFVARHGFPYVDTAAAAWNRIMARGVEKVLVLIADVEQEVTWAPLLAAATKLAQEYINDIGVVYLGKDFFERVSQFGLSGKTFPAAMILIPKLEKTIPFPEEDALSEENLRKFIDDIISGKLVAKVKSAPVPETNDGPVTILVGSTFEDLVINNDNDVLVEYYAPWCAHCKHLEPTFVQLGHRYADNDKIVIAKMDSTTNDNDRVEVDGYPTIAFFPAGKKDSPIIYEKPRNLQSFIAFLEEHATNLQGKADTAPAAVVNDEL